jgi:hypothetical protein
VTKLTLLSRFSDGRPIRSAKVSVRLDADGGGKSG